MAASPDGVGHLDGPVASYARSGRTETDQELQPLKRASISRPLGGNWDDGVLG